jgi:hypothetical protein
MALSRKKQNLIVIVIAVVIILSSIVTTVYVSEVMGERDSDNRGYQNVTFTDAVLACESDTKQEFGSSLSQLVIDRHSSRYDADAFVYKIFLEAYTPKGTNELSEFFVTCYVKSSNGRVSRFDVFENVESNDSEAVRKGGDKFIEWPQ